MKGTDQSGSLEFIGMIKLIDYINAARKALGDSEKKEVINSAKEKLKRSLVLKMALKKGTVLTEDHFILKSPGTGLDYRKRNLVIGKNSITDLDEDTLSKTSDVN